MRFGPKALFGRGGRLGLFSDLAMVTGAALRVARRPAASGLTQPRSSPVELVLVGGAAFRLLRRIRKVRRRRRATAGATD